MEAVLDMVRYRQMIVIETREQIAEEIEAKCENPIADSYRAGCWEYQDDSFGVICTHIEDAAIARGEHDSQ